MRDEAGGVDDGGRRPVEDFELEALLTGGGTDREELAALDRFLDEIRAPFPHFDPQPSAELVRLFSEGNAGALGPPPGVSDGRVLSSGAPGRARPVGRKPVRKLAKVAVATTTAALAVTLAAAAQVLPGSQSKTPIGVSGPATPVRVGANQSVTVRSPDVATAPGVTLQQPSASASALRTAPTTRSVADVDLNALSPDALARLPLDVLRILAPETLARLPVEVLRALPGDVLARLSPESLRTLPPDVLAKLPLDALRSAPGEVLARLSVEVLRTLPTDALLRLPADAVRTLPGDLLARFPLERLRALPPDLQSRLPADILRLVLGSPTPGVTTSTTGAVRP